MLLDGGRLYFRANGGGAGFWVYRYMLKGRAREMGLGSAPTVSLAEARDAATTAFKLKAQRIDPIDNRRSRRDAERLEVARSGDVR